MRISLFCIAFLFALLTPSITLGDEPTSAPDVSVEGYVIRVANPLGLVGAEVIFDGEWRGVTPLTIEGVQPGKHTLLLRAEGFYDLLKVIDVSQEGVSIQAELSPSVKVPLLFLPKNLKRIGVGAIIASGVFLSASKGLTLANRQPASVEFSSTTIDAIEPRDTSIAATGFAVAGDATMFIGVGALLVQRVMTKRSSE